MPRLRVIVCDDHRMMREALAGYLVAQPAIGSVEVVGDADTLIRLARRGADVLVLDLRLALDETGLEVLEALQNLGIAVPVLTMGAAGDLDIAARALSLGALGYCPKTSSPQTLYDAVVDVAGGRAFIPDEVVEPLLHKLLAEIGAAEQSRAVLATLTPREEEVLRLLVLGVRRQEIAHRLGLSSNTVRTHLRHLMDKLDVSSQLAAAARGRELFDRLPSVPTGADASISRVIDLTDDARRDNSDRGSAG